MVLVVAIIRKTAVDNTIDALKAIGVKGITITEVKGVGDELNLYRKYVFHTRLEILAPEEDAERITEAILAHTSSGTRGDGLIMVHPIRKAVKIRTKQSCW